MTTLLPKEMRVRMLALLRAQAESLDWQRRSTLERASFYENWAKEPAIGGVLAQFMDPRKVRVYIKDSLMKPYQRARLHDDSAHVLATLGISAESIAVQLSFSQPHGRLLADGRLICWGNSRDWKSVLFAVFERAFTRGSVPFAAVLMEAGRPTDETTKETASEAQARLGITKLLWTDQQ